MRHYFLTICINGGTILPAEVPLIMLVMKPINKSRQKLGYRLFMNQYSSGKVKMIIQCFRKVVW